MSRPNLPPTPAMSGEFIVQDKPLAPEGPDPFALPPAALTPTRVENPSKESGLYCPASPTSPDFAAAGQPRGTAAGKKHRLDDLDLPPPPTRSRKIIQMNPKAQASGAKQPKENTNNNAKAASNGQPKKKQPGPNNSGRKKARKTAHCVIERRRRSKMNEEFGTLKDMIPACRGQDMHKLAILQASIDYVNYLEKCIQDLKDPETGPKGAVTQPTPGPPSPTSPDVLNGVPGLEGSTYSSTTSPELLPGGTQGDNTSPYFSSRSQIPGAVESANTVPTLALDPLRNEPGAQQPLPYSWPGSQVSANSSPLMPPSDDHVGQASAALLMLNQDRRWTAESTDNSLAAAHLRSDRYSAQEMPRRTGVSVRDLLIS